MSAGEMKVRAWADTQAPRGDNEAERVFVYASAAVNFPYRRDE